MCSKDCECTCCEEEVEVTPKEFVINDVIDELKNGACVGCTLSMMFDFAYDLGKKDLAAESIEFYADVLEENIGE